MVDGNLATFLAQGYKYKEIGDYGVGRNAIVTMTNADDAIRCSTLFIDCISGRLSDQGDKHR